jgi:putative sterol carrier protein
MGPATFREGIRAMPRFFDAEEAKELRAVICFEVTGGEAGVWLVEIGEGRCQVREGTEAAIEIPTLTIRTSSEAWLAIMRRELNPVAGFLTHRITASGDLTLLHRLSRLFPFGKRMRPGSRRP